MKNVVLDDHAQHKSFSSDVTSVTFYVVLAETVAVILIPAFTNCICGMFCRKRRRTQAVIRQQK